MNHTPNPEREAVDMMHDALLKSLPTLQQVANRLGMASAVAPHLRIDGRSLKDLSTMAHRAVNRLAVAHDVALDLVAYRRPDITEETCPPPGEADCRANDDGTCPACPEET